MSSVYVCRACGERVSRSALPSLPVATVGGRLGLRCPNCESAHTLGTDSELDLERRLILARAFAMEHGVSLGFHDEGDQLAWDRKACAVLRVLDQVAPRRKQNS